MLQAEATIPPDRKKAFNPTSYSNRGDSRNGVRTGTSCSASQRSQSTGNSDTNDNGVDGTGSSAGIKNTCQPGSTISRP